jgi:hypothetical protein
VSIEYERLHELARNINAHLLTGADMDTARQVIDQA